MKLSDAIAVARYVAGAFRQADTSEAAAAVLADQLLDLDHQATRVVVRSMVAAGRPFPPTPGEIRNAYFTALHRLPTVAEIVAAIVTARASGRVEDAEYPHPIVREVVLEVGPSRIHEEWGYTTSKYARIHEFGGTILPKRGRFLVFEANRANRRGKGTKVFARSVTIPPRLRFFESFQKDTGGRSIMLRAAVAEALGMPMGPGVKYGKADPHPVYTGEGVSYVHRRGSESDEDVLQKLLRANAGLSAGGSAGGGADPAAAAGKLGEAIGAGTEPMKATAAALEGAKVSADATTEAAGQAATSATGLAESIDQVPPKIGELTTANESSRQAVLDAVSRLDQEVKKVKEFVKAFSDLGKGG